MLTGTIRVSNKLLTGKWAVQELCKHFAGSHLLKWQKVKYSKIDIHVGVFEVFEMSTHPGYSRVKIGIIHNSCIFLN